jgi:hypothetical protein
VKYKDTVLSNIRWVLEKCKEKISDIKCQDTALSNGIDEWYHVKRKVGEINVVDVEKMQLCPVTVHISVGLCIIQGQNFLR